MINQALGLSLAVVFLALSPCQVKANGAETVEKSQKTIEERTAGVHARQPDAERAWMEVLPEMLEAPAQEGKEAKETAEKAVSAAKGQQSLVKTYTDNIWARVKSEFEDKGLRYDEEYLRRLVDANRENGLYENTHVYVFISESVPGVTLRNYQNALMEVPTTFVLRGLVGEDPSNFQPTQEWVQRMLCGEPPYETGSKCFMNPVDISPNLYRIFGIDRVPALVYVPDPAQIASCGVSPMPDKDFFVWYGDLAPSYVLEQIRQLRPDDETLRAIIGKVGR